MKKIISIILLAVALYGAYTVFNKEEESVVVSVSEKTINEDLGEYFVNGSLVGDVTIVPCTLSAGTQTECYQFTVTSSPRTETVGPWCPSNISDGVDAGGMWLENGEKNDVDGLFIKNLSAFYEDDAWQMYDEETGEVYSTDTKEACAAAARPDVDEAYQNHCVQCKISYLDEVPEITYVIPVSPTVLDKEVSVNAQSGVGVAFNGVRFDGPAPVEQILGAYTLAPFDDCGGHVNLNVGYHYHAATDCAEKVSLDDNHESLIGFALDGYGIYLQADTSQPENTNLDSCNGHATDTLDYHYHAGDIGSNEILSCYTGEYGCVLDDANETCDASQAAERRGPPR